MLFFIQPEEAVCANCRHYVQHYTVERKLAFPTNCGHCVYPRLKDRRPGTAACGYFEKRRKEDDKT